MKQAVFNFLIILLGQTFVEIKAENSDTNHLR